MAEYEASRISRETLRENLIASAALRLAGQSEDYSVTIRNLSATGLMAEGDVAVLPGITVSIAVPNIGWVNGMVAWVQDDRFGVAFQQEVDPAQALPPRRPHGVPQIH
jgi:hypothetical protein